MPLARALGILRQDQRYLQWLARKKAQLAGAYGWASKTQGRPLHAGAPLQMARQLFTVRGSCIVLNNGRRHHSAIDGSRRVHHRAGRASCVWRYGQGGGRRSDRVIR